MKKPIQFFVYPKRGTQHYAFRVTIFRTQKSVHRDYRSHGGRGGMPIAFCRTFFEPITWIKTGKVDEGMLGELIFNAGNMDMGTIAHECNHAALHYCTKIKKKSFVKRDYKRKRPHEEIMCHATGDMVNQIVNKMIEEGLDE